MLEAVITMLSAITLELVHFLLHGKTYLKYDDTDTWQSYNGIICFLPGLTRLLYKVNSRVSL